MSHNDAVEVALWLANFVDTCAQNKQIGYGGIDAYYQASSANWATTAGSARVMNTLFGSRR